MPCLVGQVNTLFVLMCGELSYQTLWTWLWSILKLGCQWTFRLMHLKSMWTLHGSLSILRCHKDKAETTEAVMAVRMTNVVGCLVWVRIIWKSPGLGTNAVFETIVPTQWSMSYEGRQLSRTKDWFPQWPFFWIGFKLFRRVQEYCMFFFQFGNSEGNVQVFMFQIASKLFWDLIPQEKALKPRDRLWHAGHLAKGFVSLRKSQQSWRVPVLSCDNGPCGWSIRVSEWFHAVYSANLPTEGVVFNGKWGWHASATLSSKAVRAWFFSENLFICSTQTVDCGLWLQRLLCRHCRSWDIVANGAMKESKEKHKKGVGLLIREVTYL